MVTPTNTAQGTSGDKGITANRLSPCNPATQMSGDITCSCFYPLINSFCKPNFIKHWLYARYDHSEGCKTGKDAISIIEAVREELVILPWEGHLLKRDSSCMGLEGTRSSSTAETAELVKK